MLYYKSKRKIKADLIQYLLDNKDMVWTSKVPVYSTVLRPQHVTVESYFYNSMDKQIYPLTNMSIKLKTAPSVEVPLYLYQSQMRVNELWSINFSIIDTKHGFIRKNVIGGEFNLSGRSVIVLDPTLKIDEVDVSYKQFIVQFRSDIIREVAKNKKWSITRASNYVSSKFEYDEYLYSIMMKLVKEDGKKIILNRNPTIKFGSILLMKIRNIKKDSSDYTLAIPSSILPGLKSTSKALSPGLTNTYLIAGNM